MAGEEQQISERNANSISEYAKMSTSWKCRERDPDGYHGKHQFFRQFGQRLGRLYPASNFATNYTSHEYLLATISLTVFLCFILLHLDTDNGSYRNNANMSYRFQCTLRDRHRYGGRDILRDTESRNVPQTSQTLQYTTSGGSHHRLRKKTTKLDIRINSRYTITQSVKTLESKSKVKLC